MSLNPSNAIAARDNPGKTMFANLARGKRYHEVNPDTDRCVMCGQNRFNREKSDYCDYGWAEVCQKVDEVCLEELSKAGIGHDPTDEPADWLRENREVPFGYIGTHCRWMFRRAWYYWVAEGPGIPCDLAEEFHKEWGTQVRVDGHCGCPSPLYWFEGFSVGLYHIDTQEGLNAFAKLLSSIHKPRKEE